MPTTANDAPFDIVRRATAELLGTAGLLAAIVGSGIMAQRLAAGNTALALLINSLVTGAALVALIAALWPVSGAHFNPAITLAAAYKRLLTWPAAAAYLGAQIVGALLGVAAANAMFAQPVFFVSHHVRHGADQLLGESVATFGLLAVVWGCARSRPAMLPFAVGGYITAAYWFTSSTSFANPAVTIGRALSDTFAGIRPDDVLPFIGAQLLGAAVATALFAWLVPESHLRPKALP